MFNITIQGATFEEFQDNVAKAAEQISGAHRITGDVHTVLTEKQMEDAKKEQSKEAVQDEPKKKSTKKSTSTKKKAEKVEETNVEVEAEPEVAQPTSVELSYDKDIKPTVLKFAQAKGRDALVEILDSFGVATAQNLEPQQFGAFIDAINEELGDE